MGIDRQLLRARELRLSVSKYTISWLRVGLTVVAARCAFESSQAWQGGTSSVPKPQEHLHTHTPTRLLFASSRTHAIALSRLPRTLTDDCKTHQAMGLQFCSRRLARYASRCLLLAILRPQEGIRALLPTCTKCTSSRKEDDNGSRGVAITGVRYHCASCGENW